MRRLVLDKKVLHYKLDRHYIIPTKALEAYTRSNGKASWLEQKENVNKHEARTIDSSILSLPVDKFDKATTQDVCLKCKTHCWHSDITEGRIKEFPEDYKVYCYKCALEFDK